MALPSGYSVVWTPSACVDNHSGSSVGGRVDGTAVGIYFKVCVVPFNGLHGLSQVLCLFVRLLLVDAVYCRVDRDASRFRPWWYCRFGEEGFAGQVRKTRVCG